MAFALWAFGLRADEDIENPLEMVPGEGKQMLDLVGFLEWGGARDRERATNPDLQATLDLLEELALPKLAFSPGEGYDEVPAPAEDPDSWMPLDEAIGYFTTLRKVIAARDPRAVPLVIVHQHRNYIDRASFERWIAWHDARARYSDSFFGRLSARLAIGREPEMPYGFLPAYDADGYKHEYVLERYWEEFEKDLDLALEEFDKIREAGAVKITFSLG